MDYTTVAFPGLGIDFFTMNKVAIPIFGGIRWYAIIIAAGFLLAAFYCLKRVKQFELTMDNLLDVIIYSLPAAVIGARIYYVLFMPGSYSSFWEYFAIWQGGLAIYGAVIAAAITAYTVSRFKKLDFKQVFDLGALGLLIGQAIGRFGNFVNGEAFGGTTDLPWGMLIKGAATTPVHPTFLYEALWNILGFVILHFYSKRRKFAGEIFLLYVFWYGLGRVFIEGMRQDSLYFFGMRVSQVLAGASCLAAAVVLGVCYFKGRKSAVKK